MEPDHTHVSNHAQGTPFYVAPETVRHQQVRGGGAHLAVAVAPETVRHQLVGGGGGTRGSSSGSGSYLAVAMAVTVTVGHTWQ